MPAGFEATLAETAPAERGPQPGEAEAIFRLTPEDREMLDVLEEKMALVRARVRSVAAGRTPGLFVHGTGGIGKSYTVLGELDRIGTIAAGKDADLIVVHGDPSTNINEIENVETVFKDGVGYDSAKLIESVRGHVGMN